MKDTILISEIFGPTLQGEGALVGRPTVFVRTGGCDFRCRWCDTLYAVLPEFRHEWRAMTPTAIIDKVRQLTHGQPILVTVSGGNPALQPLAPLLELGHDHGLTFALETQGSMAQPWFARLEHLILSPKPPSSGMETDWEKLACCVRAGGTRPQIVLKVVVFDAADYAYARRVHAAFLHLPMYLQVGTALPGTTALPGMTASPGMTAAGSCPPHAELVAKVEWLLAQVVADGWNEVVVLPQMHVLLWGRRRGV